MNITKDKKAREVEEYPEIYKKYLQQENEWVTENLGKTESLLDVGCGDGRLTKILSEKTSKYMGIDLDEEALNKAKQENPNAEFVTGDIMNLAGLLGDNSFEVSVCLWNTLGNVEQDKKLLEQIFEVTKEKSLITVIRKGSINERKQYYEKLGLSFNLDEEGETFYSDAWGISKAYTEEELIAMCEDVGFVVEEIKEFGKIALGVIIKKSKSKL